MRYLFLTEHDEQSLATIAERLQKRVDSLRALVAANKIMGFESLEVSKHDTLMRSIKGIEGFDCAAWAAYHEEREKLGHYQAGPTKKVVEGKPKEAEPKAKKKKPQ